MERICKMPFILGCLAAMTTGIASYAAGIESRTIYLRMAVMMSVFFIIGLYAKNTVLSIEKELQDKKLEQGRVKEQQLQQQKAVQKGKASIYEYQQAQQAVTPEHPGQQLQGQQIYKPDLAAVDKEDDFKPLAMSKAVSSKVKE